MPYPDNVTDYCRVIWRYWEISVELQDIWPDQQRLKPVENAADLYGTRNIYGIYGTRGGTKHKIKLWSRCALRLYENALNSAPENKSTVGILGKLEGLQVEHGTPRHIMCSELIELLNECDTMNTFERAFENYMEKNYRLAVVTEKENQRLTDQDRISLRVAPCERWSRAEIELCKVQTFKPLRYEPVDAARK